MPRSICSSLLSMFRSEPRRRASWKHVHGARTLESLEQRALLSVQTISTVGGTTVKAGSDVAFDVILTKTDPADTKVNSFGFTLHYDNTKLTFKEFQQVLGVDPANPSAGLVFAPGNESNDDGNTDNIASTNRRLPSNWSRLNDFDFPPGDGPVKLLRAVFTAKNDFDSGTTQIGFNRVGQPITQVPGEVVNFASTPLTITSVRNQGPNAVNDAFTATAGQALNGNVINNDSDGDGGTLAVAITPAVAPAKGTLVLRSNGTFTYTPNAGALGTDTFQYTLRDGQGGTATGTVTITINDVPPIAGDGNVEVYFRGGNLHVHGDKGNNSLLISGDGTRITVQNLGNTRINGKRASFVVNAKEISGRVHVRMGRGNDTVGIKDLVVRKSIVASMQSGKDVLEMNDVSVTKNLTIYSGTGNDTVKVNTVTVGNDVLIYGYLGNDKIGVQKSKISDDLTILAQSGDDAVVVEGNSVSDNVRLSGGSGKDSMAMKGGTIGGDLSISGGSGKDVGRVDASVKVAGRRSVTGITLGASDSLFAKHRDDLFNNLLFG